VSDEEVARDRHRLVTRAAWRCRCHRDSDDLLDCDELIAISTCHHECPRYIECPFGQWQHQQ